VTTPATLTYAQFIASFPIFAKASVAMVTAKVAEANRQVDRLVWDSQANDGAAYLCAALCAQTDFGRHAEMDPKEYWDTYERLKRTVAVGAIVV
jgi:hypothetical protein